jgi:hypothetical protein
MDRGDMGGLFDNQEDRTGCGTVNLSALEGRSVCVCLCVRVREQTGRSSFIESRRSFEFKRGDIIFEALLGDGSCVEKAFGR